MSKVPIRYPYINVRKGPPYPIEYYDSEISRLAAIPGTPQYKYAHRIGLYYKCLRLVLTTSDYFRSRTTLWWLMVMMLIFFSKILRLTVYSDETFMHERMIEQTQMPTREQMNKMLGFK